MATKGPVAVIIPALNEEQTIGKVIDAIPENISRIIVVDNGSTDQTKAVALSSGAEVVKEPQRGYGAACLTGIAELKKASQSKQPVAVVFLDGDLSDDPSEMNTLLEPILERGYDMVIGSRVTGECELGALTTTQRLGNWLSCFLMKSLFGVSYTDLGPFRALKWSSLLDLNMDDRAYGWTVQMQVRAAVKNMRTTEVPVRYRRRGGGKSKVSGTIKGVVGAGTTIIYVIFREAYLARVESRFDKVHGVHESRE